MALGGGTFTAQNKKLPGTYINFVSLPAAGPTVSERGVAAMGLTLDWGADNEVFTVTKAQFEKSCQTIFGYPYWDERLKGLRDLFRNIHTLYAYKLNSSKEGVASNSFGKARYSGERGNSITTVVAPNADAPERFDVQTLFDGLVVDTQTVDDAKGLRDNAYCAFNSEAELSENPGEAMTGGKSAKADAAGHQAFLDKIESYAFNVIAAVSDERPDVGNEEANINALYAAFTKRMRDERGIKFQAVLFEHAADYEGVISVKNPVTDAGADPASLVYWVAGLEAGTAVNASALNMVYDGEFAVNADYTQEELEAFIDGGVFALHRVGGDLRVLSDINTLVTTTDEKNELFKENQTIRVIDEIATYTANLFGEKYIGKIQNNAAGRVSLWADIVKHHKELERMGAIEGFDENLVIVEPGNSKRSVVVSDAVTPVNAMAQLYMTCVIN